MTTLSVRKMLTSLMKNVNFPDEYKPKTKYVLFGYLKQRRSSLSALLEKYEPTTKGFEINIIQYMKYTDQ